MIPISHRISLDYHFALRLLFSAEVENFKTSEIAEYETNESNSNVSLFTLYLKCAITNLYAVLVLVYKYTFKLFWNEFKVIK